MTRIKFTEDFKEQPAVIRVIGLGGASLGGAVHVQLDEGGQRDHLDARVGARALLGGRQVELEEQVDGAHRVRQTGRLGAQSLEEGARVVTTPGRIERLLGRDQGELGVRIHSGPDEPDVVDESQEGEPRAPVHHGAARLADCFQIPGGCICGGIFHHPQCGRFRLAALEAIELSGF